MRKTVLLSLLLSLVFCMGVNAYTDENGRHCAGNIAELCEEVNCVSKTIVITNKITIDRPIKTSHSILLMIDESVRNGAILTVTDGGELDGFDILVQNRSADIITCIPATQHYEILAPMPQTR